VKFLHILALPRQQALESVLGRIVAPDKVVDNVGMANTLFNRLCVAKVVFLLQSASAHIHLFNMTHRENHATKISRDFKVTLGHFLAEWNNDSTSGTSYTILAMHPI
jgi:hypothetical protein